MRAESSRAATLYLACLSAYPRGRLGALWFVWAMKGSMKSNLRLAILVLFMAAAAPLAFAGTGGWVSVLKDTPAEQFDDEDLKMFLEAARSALNADTTPPQPVAWSNPDTGAGGRFLELKRSTMAGGAPCKRIKVSVYAKNRSEKSSTYTACKNAEGKWRLTSGG